MKVGRICPALPLIRTFYFVQKPMTLRGICSGLQASWTLDVSSCGSTNTYDALPQGKCRSTNTYDASVRIE